MLNTPSRSRRTRREERFWDDTSRNPIALGCTQCGELGICGGLHVSIGAFDCTGYCCGKPGSCDIVCQRNPDFVKRVREISGFSLAGVERVPAVPFPNLPRCVPLIYHGGSRTARFNPPAVALSLYQIIDRTHGETKFGTREALCDYFKIDFDTTIILSGTSYDKPIERWWELGEGRLALLRKMADLGIGAVTAPNFSLFSDVPRWDNLHAMKRIAICWQEIMAMGIPAALHVNARSDRDWRAWADFIGDRPEIVALTYEFATGASGTRRMRWHSEYLCTLAETVRRPLMLVVRGGLDVLQELARSFQRVTLLDTSAFMKTVNRKSASLSSSYAVTWKPAGGLNSSLDELLEHNYLTVSQGATRRGVLPRTR